MNQKSPSESHYSLRSKMCWLTGNRPVQLKMLSDEHIMNIRDYIRKNTKLILINGYTREDWLKAIKLEQQYRKGLIDSIFKQFSNAEMFLKDNI